MKDIDKFFHEMFTTDSLLTSRYEALADKVIRLEIMQFWTNVLIGSLIVVGILILIIKK